MLKKEISVHICKWGNALNANEGCQWMLMRKCLLAMLILMLVILMLILMLLNLNTGYADTDADLCIIIMSLCCTCIYNQLQVCIAFQSWKVGMRDRRATCTVSPIVKTVYLLRRKDCAWIGLNPSSKKFRWNKY